VNIKIGTSGFRYRVAYGLYANCKSWECQPARAYGLLVIHPWAVWIDQHAIEREIANLEPRNGIEIATEIAQAWANIQLDGWLRNLGQLMQRHVSGRKLMRADMRRSMASARHTAKMIDMVMASAFPSIKAAE